MRSAGDELPHQVSAVGAGPREINSAMAAAGVEVDHRRHTAHRRVLGRERARPDVLVLLPVRKYKQDVVTQRRTSPQRPRGLQHRRYTRATVAGPGRRSRVVVRVERDRPGVRGPREARDNVRHPPSDMVLGIKPADHGRRLQRRLQPQRPQPTQDVGPGPHIRRGADRTRDLSRPPEHPPSPAPTKTALDQSSRTRQEPQARRQQPRRQHPDHHASRRRQPTRTPHRSNATADRPLGTPPGAMTPATAPAKPSPSQNDYGGNSLRRPSDQSNHRAGPLQSPQHHNTKRGFPPAAGGCRELRMRAEDSPR